MKLAGGLLNFVNNSIGTMALDNLVVENAPRWQLELDLENKTGDKINANSVSGDGFINITNVVLLSDTLDKDFLINIAGEGVRDKINLIARVAYTPIFQYKLFYDQPTGSIGIGNHPAAPIEGFNPAIMAAPVAAQVGGYLTQLNTYNQVFNNMDMYMLMPKSLRETIRNSNKLANAPVDGGVFSPLVYQEKDRAVWFKPYSTFENVPLRNGYRVSNVSYGSLFGVDSDLKEYKHGIEVMYSAYGAYNGSHQAYQGVGITQNGGLGGATAMLYKGNFFSGLTANVGANAAEASTMYGLDNFTMLTAGLASKTGYNIELFDNKLILQPNYLMSYSFINTFDFRNSAGVNVDSSALHAIQIAPGIRIIGNLKNGWQPYLGVNMVWNILDRTKFKANDVSLPELSIKPFVEYGVGVQKHVGERFTGFAQAMIRNGGRNGISLQLGFRWRI